MSDWRISLFKNSQYFLWSKSGEKLLAENHAKNCICGQNGVPDLDCYEICIGICSYLTTFRNAHKIIEDGFEKEAEKVFRISCINEDGKNWNPHLSPFKPHHPLAHKKLLFFELKRNFVQINGPAYGNIDFNLVLPLERILSGDLHLYHVEMVEFNLTIASRCFLSKRKHPDLSPVELDKIGGVIYVDQERQIHLLKKCLSLDGKPKPLIHEILMDETLFPYLDKCAEIESNFPLQSQKSFDSQGRIYKIGDEDLDDSLKNSIILYAKLLNIYNQVINLMENESAENAIEKGGEMLRENLNSDDIAVISQFEPFNVIMSDFNLCENLEANPKAKYSLQKNCAKLYQALQHGE